MSKKALIIIIFVLVLLGGGGVYMSKRGNQPTPTPTPDVVEIQEEPTQVPTEEDVDISTFKIKVLNGTAVAGLAAKMQSALEEAGFTVSSVGNADTKDFQEVELQAKESVPASVLTKLKVELEKNYTVGSEKKISDDEEDDVVIILGTKSVPTTPKPTSSAKSTTPTPTAGATTTPTSTTTPTPTKS